MTIWINTRTGETKNQYTQPSPASEWKKKVEYSSASSYDSSYSNPALDMLAIGVATGMFDSPSPSSSDSFSGGGGDFGGGGSSGSWD